MVWSRLELNRARNVNKLKPTQVGNNLFSALVAPQAAMFASAMRHTMAAAPANAAPIHPAPIHAAPVSAADGYADGSAHRCPEPTVAARGSARRKLWELSGSAACPVTGVCLCFTDLYKLARKAGLPVAGCAEYDVHVQVVGECRRRSDMAERVQRLLDERYALHIKKAHQTIKTTEDLAHWWDQSCLSSDWAGVFWAVLTHARCTTELEHVVLGQVHMLQHQVGMAARVDHARLNDVLEEHLRLSEELELTQQRLQAARHSHARDMARLQADMVLLRGEVIRAQTERDQVQMQWQALQDREPGLLDRQTLADNNARMLAHNRQLRRELALAEQAQARGAPASWAASCQPPAADAADASRATAKNAGNPTATLRLANRAVLCVGGRTAGVPVYRDIIEQKGARFVHHDGGDEERVAQLGNHLHAADVVICQVGCISHDAYWRVKEHCKRTGKPCLFVESSSRSALERALGQAMAGTPAQPE